MLTISAKSHSYVVNETSGVAAALAAVQDSANSFFLVDEKVALLFHDTINAAAPAGGILRVKASEKAKSLDALRPIFEWLLESGCRRSSRLIVIGGGVLQDIGCFVASVLMRGLRWTLLPTTLLAQCDSCIGSKSSINIGPYKNQLGTFYPPHQVLLAFDFLSTLTDDEIHSGLGEAIKLHMIAGPAEVARLRATLGSDAGLSSLLPGIVWDSLTIKKRFIEEDEHDLGVRNILNYGHTFAHAFESATDYAIPHGIAVTMGVVCATVFAERLQLAPVGSFAEVQEWLRPYYTKYVPRLVQADPTQILEAFQQDKKNSAGKLVFILGAGPGRFRKIALEPEVVEPLLVECLRCIET